MLDFIAISIVSEETTPPLSLHESPRSPQLPQTTFGQTAPAFKRDAIIERCTPSVIGANRLRQIEFSPLRNGGELASSDQARHHQRGRIADSMEWRLLAFPPTLNFRSGLNPLQKSIRMIAVR